MIFTPPTPEPFSNALDMLKWALNLPPAVNAEPLPDIQAEPTPAAENTEAKCN